MMVIRGLETGESSRARRAIEKLLNAAGVKINGENSWDIKVHDPRLYARVIKDGSLGLGEAYMEGWWDADRIDLFTEKILRAGNYANAQNLPFILLSLRARFSNLQSRSRSRYVVDQHYDLSSSFFESFLDPYNQYTCGYFKDTDDLNVAQEQRLDLICRKLQLKQGETVLDIGCGWGGFAKYATEHYGCQVVGITISDEQAKYANKFAEGLPVEIRVQDYRDLRGEKFDKIVAAGVLEHVGYKNYRRFMEIANDSLKEGGLFLLDTIGQDFSSTAGNPWAHKYIFPGGMLPSLRQLAKATKGLFTQKDLQNLGPDYYETLRAWDKNFQTNWPNIKDQYSETFYRMIRYYFNSFAGAFKAKRIHDWHIVYSQRNDDTSYESIR